MRRPGDHRLRLHWLWFTTHGWHLTVWLQIAGHKPLAHLPWWRRHLLHLPAVRWRLWPRPWNFNGPIAGYRREYAVLREQRMALYMLVHDTAQALPTPQRVAALERAEAVLR